MILKLISTRSGIIMNYFNQIRLRDYIFTSCHYMDGVIFKNQRRHETSHLLSCDSCASERIRVFVYILVHVLFRQMSLEHC